MGCEQFPSERYRENALSFYPGQGLRWRSDAIWRNLLGPKSFRGWNQIEHEVDARSFVGKLDRTDEFLLLTPTGAIKTRCVRRLEGDNAWNLQFLKLCVGSPWNATARSTEQTPTIQQKDELDSGRRAKRVYLRQHFGQVRTHCRVPRLSWNWAAHRGMPSKNEQEMVDKGDAIKIETVGEIVEEPDATLKKRKIGEPDINPGGGIEPNGRHTQEVAGCIAAVNNLLCDVPTVDLSRDRTAMSGKFPEDELKAGRELELQNMLNFDAF